MYIENDYIYAEHNNALVCKATKYMFGPKVSTKRLVKFLPDGTPCDQTYATIDYYYEVVDPVSIMLEKEAQIAELKEQLASTDYQCLKWCEGYLSDEEYEPIKEERQAMRDKINELEDSLK